MLTGKLVHGNIMVWLFIWSVLARRFYSVATIICAATWESKPSDMYAQRRFKLACAPSQSDQNFYCPQDETLHPWLSKKRPAKIQIRLRIRAVWSDSRSLIWIFAGRTHPKVRFLIVTIFSYSGSKFVFDIFLCIALTCKWLGTSGRNMNA